MPRLPRVQYAGAIYHILTRGDGRRRLFHDDGHYERFAPGLAEEVDRSGWIAIAYCWLPNHIHALIKTPEANLCRGMQHWRCRLCQLVRQAESPWRTPVQWTLQGLPVEDEGANRRRRRRMYPVTVDAILQATALEHGTSADAYGGYRSRTGGRDVAAMLCRCRTTATLRELSARFGLSHPDSASDLVRRGKRFAESNRDVARKVASIEKTLGLNPESRV